MLGQAEYYEPRKDFFVNCTKCGYCLSVCPTFTVTLWEHFSPRGRVVLSQLFKLDFDVSKSIFTCLTCGSCENVCPADLNFTEEIEKVRSAIVRAGYGVKKHLDLLEIIMTYGNPYGEKPYEEEYKRAEVIYFPGCTALYKEKELFDATINLLEKIGVEYYVEGRQCCGSTAIRVGIGEEVARKGFENLKKAIEKTGASVIVTSCPGCYRTIKKDYKKLFGGLNVEIKHITEFVTDYIEKLRFKKTNLTVSYHDPCHLGRHMKVFEEPRILIQKVAELKELERIKNESFCCGGGGGVRAGFRDFSMMVMQERLKEVKRVGAELLITACPFCYRNLKRGDVAVKDITVLLSELIE